MGEESCELRANPRILSDLLDYQNGAIVSKTIIDKKEGTVTLFAFDKGQGLSEHTAPYDALVVVIDGEGVVTISGKDYMVGKNQAILMPANEPHSIRAESPFKMLLIMIRA